jgi:hypothetical protein
MEVKGNIGLKIHNRFDIEVKDAKTGEVIEKGQAENIVLDRMYDRLLAFDDYFDYIIFGSGTGSLDASRTTLFSRVGGKSAATYSLVRSYPTSTWTRKINLGVSEYNGNTLTEIGIGDGSTYINTHAMITDAVGNPISIEKTDLKIIDIYATVYVEVYSVDSGLFFYGNGLRDYLTGGSSPNTNIALYASGIETDDYGNSKAISASKTTNATEKTVTVSCRFDVGDFNKDVKAIDWQGLGLRWKLPRTGVYTGTAKTDVAIGTGDGVEDTFELPNAEVTSLTVYVDGTSTTAYTYDNLQRIVFDSPPADTLLITADYTTKYIPKDSDHVLDVEMKIGFGLSQPSPVVPDPGAVDVSETVGQQTLSGGDTETGYFGEVSSVDLISGADLCELIGLTAGTVQNSDAGWLKYYNNEDIEYVAKKTIMHSVSWNSINAVGAVFGDKLVNINNRVYAVRLLSSEEWNRLIYPVHVNYGTFASFSNADLNVATGDGIATWTSTPVGSYRIDRGYSSVESSGDNYPSYDYSYYGFRPVLKYLYTLGS